MLDGAVARDLRLMAGLTMEQVADEAGVDARTVFRYEQGTPVRVETVQRIVKVLRVGLERRAFALDAARMKLETVAA